MTYYGSCLCGTISYKIEGTLEHFFLCHCVKCQKDSGSAHAANLFSNNAQLIWVTGESNIQVYNHKQEGHIKAFCKTCGSALPNIQLNGELLVVPAGSLDTEIHLRPTSHIYYDERASWDNYLEQIMKLPKGPK